MILAIANVILGFVGFCIALYIYHKKTKKTVLVCPIGSNCDAVVHSSYSQFFGIPVERIGMFYYFLITIFYGIAIFVPSLTIGLAHFIMLGVTLGSFLFSVYLVSVQGFVIHEWCAWCLGSASVSTFIFFTNFFLGDTNIMPYLIEYKNIILILHAIAAAVGVGAATVTDTLFFRYLSDKKISYFEADTLRTLSTMIWFAIGALVLTGVGLYIPEAERYAAASKFLAKMLAVVVLIVNGMALHFVVSPRLTKIKFEDESGVKDTKNDRLRHIAFALGSISITSWYFIFIMGSLRSIDMAAGHIIGIYLIILLIAILGSQFFAERMSKKTPIE